MWLLLPFSKTQLVETHETPIVMTMYFIWQGINTGIHHITYQASQQIGHIIKLVIHNEVQQAQDFEARQTNSSNNSVTSTPTRCTREPTCIVNKSQSITPYSQPIILQWILVSRFGWEGSVLAAQWIGVW